MVEGKYQVYVLKDPNTLEIRYVGASVNVTRRYSRHIFNGHHPHRRIDYWINSLLSKDLLPIIEVIAIVGENEWEKKEKELIKYYKEKSFDLTDVASGGNGNDFEYENNLEHEKRILKIKQANSQRIYGEEECLKCVENAGYIHMGCKRSILTKKRLSETKIGSLNPQFGKSPTLETREKISKALKGVKRNAIAIQKYKKAASKRTKPVLQMDVYGKLVARWESAKVASIETRCERSNIIACCKGRLKSTGGYIWKYETTNR